MKNIALLNQDNIVENIILLEDDVDVEAFINQLGVLSNFLDVTDVAGIAIGQTYYPELNKFKPLNFRENFVWSQELWAWIPPVAPPEDATWVFDFGPEPEGHSELSVKKIYFWMDEYQAWGLAQCVCNPKPEGDYYWNSLDREWQMPTSEKPGGNYRWDAIEAVWEEMPEEIARPTE